MKLESQSLPEKWMSLPADERKARWRQLSQEEQKEITDYIEKYPEASRSAVAKSSELRPSAGVSGDKPLSATACHVLAAICLIGAALWLVLAIGRFTDQPAFLIAGSCAVSGVFWWALGDIVVGVSRKKADR